MNDIYPAEIDHASQRPSVWLMTFADITALLLAFFVMLFAMSSLEPEKWQFVISRVVTVDQREETKAPPPYSPDTVSSVRPETNPCSASGPPLRVTYTE